MIVSLAVAAFAVAGAVTVIPLSTDAQAQASGVEDEGAGCAVNPGSTVSNTRLPDPFTRINGTRISTREDWRCRRAEIREQAETFVYGQKPAPPTVTGTVSNSSITVNASANGRSASFSASVQLPTTGTAPFPFVIVYGGLGADVNTIRSTGVAVVNYDPFTVGREGTARNNKQGAFYTIYGNTSSTGLLMAWAWGASRIIDVVSQSGGNVLRANGVGVTGCSRFGKGAFVAGAFDQRVGLTMPIESGTGGAPILRGVATESGAQPLSSAYGEQPWLGDAFNSFTGNPSALPVDTHEMIGMIAPRGLFIMENPHVDWLGARSGSVAALAGAEVYTALGARDNISYWSDTANGTHCAVRSEWTTTIRQYLQEFLLGTGNATSVFRVAPSKSGNLAEWRTWTTPILGGGNQTSSPPPVTSSPPPVTSSPPPVTSSPPPAGQGCTAAVSLNQWNGGFVATVRVTAGAARINGWTVTMTLPAGATIANAWNVDRSGNTGTVNFTNVAFNGPLNPGQFTEFGFQSTGNGSGLAPTCTPR